MPGGVAGPPRGYKYGTLSSRLGVRRGVDNPLNKKLPVRKPEMWPRKGLEEAIMEAKARIGL